MSLFPFCPAFQPVEVRWFISNLVWKQYPAGISGEGLFKLGKVVLRNQLSGTHAEVAWEDFSRIYGYCSSGKINQDNVLSYWLAASFPLFQTIPSQSLGGTVKFIWFYIDIPEAVCNYLTPFHSEWNFFWCFSLVSLVRGYRPRNWTTFSWSVEESDGQMYPWTCINSQIGLNTFLLPGGKIWGSSSYHAMGSWEECLILSPVHKQWSAPEW